MTNSTLPTPQPTDYQVQQFRDVRCLLANLYHHAIKHRKHLLTKKGYTAATQESYDPKELNEIQFFLTVLLLKFMEKRWEGITLVGTPKIPDVLIVQLQNHTLFEGKPIETYVNDMKLVAKEKRVLRELALRIS
jgi:hypothetical protein